MEKYLPDFLIIPSQIILDQDLQPLDGYVYGVIYWYTKLRMERCIASSKRIGEILNSAEGAIQNSINRLTHGGYIQSVYDRQKHTRELIPLVSFNNKDELELINTSNDAVAPHQMMKGTTSNDESTRAHLRTPNKNIKKEEATSINTSRVKTPEKKESYGNPQINEIIETFKTELNLRLLDGTEKENRRYAHLLLQKYDKLYPGNGLGKIKALIFALSTDELRSPNYASIKKLYYNSEAIKKAFLVREGYIQ